MVEARPADPAPAAPAHAGGCREPVTMGSCRRKGKAAGSGHDSPNRTVLLVNQQPEVPREVSFNTQAINIS